MQSALIREPSYVFRLTNRLILRWTALSLVLFFISIAGVSAFYQAIHGQSWSGPITIPAQRPVWQMLLTLVAFVGLPIGTFGVHELIHGLAFSMFGGSPRYGVGLKWVFPYAYATSPGDRFSRNAFIAIGLAPLVVLDVVGLLLLLLVPQATWLGWVIALNTSGASGDLWLATLLLRSPSTILVEDRETGCAIYAPPDVDLADLPFPQLEKTNPSPLWTWINGVLAALLALLVVVLLLPPVFALLHIPSFVVGTDAFWVLRWQSSESGFGIQMNGPSLLAIAITLGFMGMLVRLGTRPPSG